MPKRKHSPSPSPDPDSPDIVFVKMEVTPSPDKRESDSSDLPDVKPKVKSEGSKPGRKPGVSYASKKWSGAELRQLFLLGLGGGESGGVPAARFEAMPGRSVSQCTNAWRQRVIPVVLKALGDVGEPGETGHPDSQ
ncbi:hypothetical protein CcaverHIS002_0500910 [Cutaneotrichosporon cavernicola]|uniref:Myb-like domain-containing protein n=1 Tax=Cutaneotrichosporon cavernicola TaxID=279322 RepID=A0AA48QXR3_9TREE|nr:uncharacterized protein CcaverHIS019_0600910 [Cutaneotrichosporon cavernicola]BEI84690.1 hypothetical protein CcaverHIS002_0500910 [Cutaneotrichosporon cavernicola]BEI93632.1 hypothetical protein CcaverHIS019_0600910 [Cutaneotrichosporon cavernicola]BEJ01409.1 hypothetical protein CcaverHIS631_0600910 [Cutaneotrichosporon cavernicola]BEJ09176.1 hypothetical protein CcaverHIS641_0600910 [Cutaneotrichosporon cavernicola]